MAYCVNCGKEYEEGEKFCTSCGSPINGEIESKNENENESERESKTFSPSVQNVDKPKSVSFLSAKKYYILGAFVLAVIVGAFVYISSTPKEPADVGMQKYCKAYINGDTEMLKKFDKDTKSDKHPFKELFADLWEMKPGNKDFTRLQLENIADAVVDKVYTNNNVSCRLIEQKGKEAKVEITVDYYNFDDIQYKVQDYAEKNAKKKPLFTSAELLTMTPKELKEALYKGFTKAIVEVIKETKPVKRDSFVVDCVYTKDKWQPQNIGDFMEQVTSISTPKAVNLF